MIAEDERDAHLGNGQSDKLSSSGLRIPFRGYCVDLTKENEFFPPFCDVTPIIAESGIDGPEQAKELQSLRPPSCACVWAGGGCTNGTPPASISSPAKPMNVQLDVRHGPGPVT